MEQEQPESNASKTKMPSSTDSRAEGGKARGTKRYKMTISCDECRSRKLACDSGVPSCKRCLERGRKCTYMQKINALSVAYIQELERKLGVVHREDGIQFTTPEGGANEGMLSVHSAEQLSGAVRESNFEAQSAGTVISSKESPKTSLSYIVNTSEAARKEVGSLNPSGLAPNSSTSHSSSHSNSNDGKPTQRSAQMESPVDAMGAGSTINAEEGNGKEFYGSSATASFMRILSAAVDSQEPSTTSQPTNSRSGHSQGDRKYRMTSYNGRTSQIENWVLPPRKIANEFVNRYLRYVYPLYPFVHKPSFIAAYEAIWSNENENDDDIFYAILNLVFAIACHHDYETDPETVYRRPTSLSASSAYYNRAQTILTSEMNSRGSLLLVQAFLLSGQYLQSTQQAESCWNTIGMAIRIGQGLGIHLENNVHYRFSVIEKEICKRVWNGCLMMDSLVSMTFGRPLMASTGSDTGYPTAVDDQFITDEGILPQAESSSISEMAFYIESLKLYRILSAVLQKFYLNQDNDSEPADLIASIFRYEQQLQQFYEDLPSFLHLDKALNVAPFERQSFILHVRRLHLKIMLYRTLLLSDSQTFGKLSKVKGSPLYDSVCDLIVKNCIDSAVQLVELLSNYYFQSPHIMPALWYNVFYVYNCSMVLLAAKLQPSFETKFDLSLLTTSWARCLGLLQSMATKSTSAERCLNLLLNIEERISLREMSINTSTEFQPPANNISPFDFWDANLYYSSVCQQFSGSEFG